MKNLGLSPYQLSHFYWFSLTFHKTDEMLQASLSLYPVSSYIYPPQKKALVANLSTHYHSYSANLSHPTLPCNDISVIYSTDKSARLTISVFYIFYYLHISKRCISAHVVHELVTMLDFLSLVSYTRPSRPFINKSKIN